MAPVRVEGDTIVAAFHHMIDTRPDQTAMRQRLPKEWITVSWAEYGSRVSQVAAGLGQMGIGKGDCVAILSNNRFEWHLADLGILVNGSVSVPLYPTSSAEQIAYLVGHCGARVCFVENPELLARILEVRDQLPALEHLALFDDGHRIDDPLVGTLTELESLGSSAQRGERDEVRTRASAVRPGDLATLVYTSGTTGPPKAAMISHGNVMWTIRSVVSMFQVRDGERFLSFLPLSHVAERMISDFAAIAIGGETWFARSLGTIAQDLRDCRPTIFFGVPRIWEKFQEAVLQRVGEDHGPRRALIDLYLGLSERTTAATEGSGKASAMQEVLQLPTLALDLSVGAAIRRELGLDQAHILVSGAAPIHAALLHWLHVIGLPVLELYGQTETCGPTSCNPPDDNRIGTVGQALPGVDLGISDDGEILVRGGNVCAGYLDDPRSTAELIDEQGWLHSGDTGTIDDDGYLRVTGRKKDLIITAAGQNIAPQEIEMALQSHQLVSEAVVIGEGRRYLTALITLDNGTVCAWAQDHGKVAELEALAGDPDLQAEIHRIVDDENARRANVERIRKFRVLAHDFTVSGNELTPTLKVKRNVVSDKYRRLIDEMYLQDA